MDNIISELASPQVSDKDKFLLVVRSDEAIQGRLYESLMKELVADPERNLSAWESWLLSANGQRVSVRLLKSDGSELGLDEIRALLDKMVVIGKPLTVEELLEREGISVRRQWNRAEE